MRAILPHIRGSEIERARRKRPEDLAAYGLTMRAFPFVFASNPAAAKQGLEFLSRAIEIEPDYAPATALAAWCHAQLVLYNGTPSPNQERRDALLLSERAGILDPDDPIVLTARCAVHTMAGQLDHAGALIARALDSIRPLSGVGNAAAGLMHIQETGKPPSSISTKQRGSIRGDRTRTA